MIEARRAHTRTAVRVGLVSCLLSGLTTGGDVGELEDSDGIVASIHTPGDLGDELRIVEGITADAPISGATTNLGSQLIFTRSNVVTPCAADGDTLCLSENRFRVEVRWRDFEGNTGSGQVVPFGSDDSGLFWFFDAANWEMLVKVLDGCGVNEHYWVFAAATTNVETTLKVTDTQTEESRYYFNELGVAAAAITDAMGFDTCP